MSEVATLGGGCFWCLEAVFLQVDGVISVESGYAGGYLQKPSYRDVCAGVSGHAEVIKVTFDSDRLSYREVLEIFFVTHDPTQWNRQGNDVGPQYRSIVLTDSDAQREVVLQLIRDMEKAGIYSGTIVTRVESLNGNYWAAEPEHQNYYAHHPEEAYCTTVIGPKVAAFRRKFIHRLQTPGAR